MGAYGATLNGLVNPEGSPTSAYFEYGTTTSYGTSTASVEVGSGKSWAEVSKAVKGLKPNTLYHYRVVANNAEGGGYGEDGTFTTGEAVFHTQHWFRCTYGGGNVNYADSACSEKVTGGKGEYGLEWYAVGAPQEINLAGMSTTRIDWHQWGYHFEVKCSTLSDKEGTVENPSVSKAGILGEFLTLGSCEVAKPTKPGLCTVSPIEIQFSGAATEVEEVPALKLSPVGSAYIVTFVMQGEGCLFKSETFAFVGSLTAIQNSSNQLEFSEGSSSLTIAGSPAIFTGAMTVSTVSGQRLVLAP